MIWAFRWGELFIDVLFPVVMMVFALAQGRRDRAVIESVARRLGGAMGADGVGAGTSGSLAWRLTRRAALVTARGSWILGISGAGGDVVVADARRRPREWSSLEGAVSVDPHHVALAPTEAIARERLAAIAEPLAALLPRLDSPEGSHLEWIHVGGGVTTSIQVRDVALAMQEERLGQLLPAVLEFAGRLERPAAGASAGRVLSVVDEAGSQHRWMVAFIALFVAFNIFMPVVVHATGTLVGSAITALLVAGLLGGGIAVLHALAAGDPLRRRQRWVTVPFVAATCSVAGPFLLVLVNAATDREPPTPRELGVTSVREKDDVIQFGRIDLEELGGLSVPLDHLPRYKVGDRVRASVRVGLLGRLRVDSVEPLAPSVGASPPSR